MASLEAKIRWAEREDKDADPWAFYLQNYAGTSSGNRTELEIKDCGLHHRLKKEGLLHKIPRKTEINSSILYQQLKSSVTRLTFAYFTRTLRYSESSVGLAATQTVMIGNGEVQLKELLYDDFVIAGKTLLEIAAEIGSTHRQRADQYLRGTGQYEKWEAMKERRKEQEAQEEVQLTDSRKKLLDVLVAKMVDDTKNDWPLQTALRIYHRRSREKSDSYSLEKLAELFEWYEYAVEQHDPMGLDEFSKETGLSIVSIGRLFREAGVHTLRWKGQHKGYVKPRIKLSQPEKQRIKKGLTKTRFSGIELGYFLRLSFWNVQQSSPGAEQRKPRSNYGILSFSYKTASEIYEARASMSDDEIQQVLGLQDPQYEKYLLNEKEISNEIMKGLRAIYPEKARYVQKPFVSPEIRHLQQQETFEQVVIEDAKKAIREGAKGNIELEEMTGYSILTIQKYAARAGIELPRFNRNLGNLLQYCHEHYPGITRKELRRKDNVLYNKLSRQHLLGAIPKK